MSELPVLLCDFYKISHKPQYPKGTEFVYSTWTPRVSRIESINKVVFYGLQGFTKKYLIDFFNDNFFNKSKISVITEYERFISHTLGTQNPDSSHIAALHDLGYLPIKIKAVEEGTLVDIRVPMLTIENTDSRFFWLTNFLETLMSMILWMPSTSATIAFEYWKTLQKYAAITDIKNRDFVKFQGHDFSMRGMAGLEAAELSGSGHLISFNGTDTIPAIMYHEKYYNADITKELVGTSIPATEHSVMCAGGEDNEYDTYDRLITEIYPDGFISIVSDTWDYWYVLGDTLPRLKNKILARNGKVVIRPDSGDPVKMICGDDEGDNELSKKGTIEVLWDLFGGHINTQGFKVLNPHIGCIYGDAITLYRCEEICDRLMKKGFASTNIVFGIGSYTYQYNTRDTFGFALKATHVVNSGKEIHIFKNPKTDPGSIKKSQKGRVAVCEYTHPGTNKNATVCYDGLNIADDFEHNLLQPIFENGKLLKETSLEQIRHKLASEWLTKC